MSPDLKPPPTFYPASGDSYSIGRVEGDYEEENMKGAPGNLLLSENCDGSVPTVKSAGGLAPFIPARKWSNARSQVVVQWLIWTR